MKRRHFIVCSASALAAPAALLAQASKQESDEHVIPSNGIWGSAAPLPVKIQELYPAIHKSKLYVAGGIGSKLGAPYFTKRFFSYDPSDDTWSDETDLPESLHHAALVSTGSRLFLVGGFNGAYTRIWRMRKRVYEYKAGEWLPMPSLPEPQAEGVLTHHQNEIHLVSGQSPKGEANSKRSDHTEVSRHLLWQPGQAKWQTAAPIPLARNSATGGWVEDQLIITGGRNANGNFNATHIFDKKEDRWREAQPLPLPQAGTASVVVDDGIIVFGGEIFVPEAGVFKNTWRYSLSQDQWTAYPSMITPRHGIGAGRIGNRIYVVGGASGPSAKGTSDLNEVLTLTL